MFTKGLDLLLEAFALIVQRLPHRHPRLVLAGPDWNGGRTWLELRAATLGIGDRVHFTGALRGTQVGALLASADIYVQLSRHEGFPLSVAEALLAHKPAVLSDAIGTMSYPEIAALPHIRMVPPRAEEAALAMAAAAEALPQLALAARRSGDSLREFFSWDRIARLHLAQYWQLLRA
jgi:glycosyltransferase involved in cell wall biosynthesis